MNPQLAAGLVAILFIASVVALVWAADYYRRGVTERAATAALRAERDHELFERLRDELTELVMPADWEQEPSGRHHIELVDTLAGVRPLVGPDGATQEGEWP